MEQKTCIIVSSFVLLPIYFTSQIQVERSKEDRRFRGIGSSLARIGREEGLLGYFKGNGTNVVRIIPYVAVQFAAYEELKKVGVLTCI